MTGLFLDPEQPDFSPVQKCRTGSERSVPKRASGSKQKPYRPSAKASAPDRMRPAGHSFSSIHPHMTPIFVFSLYLHDKISIRTNTTNRL